MTTLISWLLRGKGRGEQANLVLDFSLVLITYTIPPLVSLSPISRSAGRPLSIKNKSRPSKHQLYSGLCYCTALFSPFSSFIPGHVTVQLYSQQFSFIPSHVTVQLYSWPCYCSALFPAISSFYSRLCSTARYLWIIALITIKVAYDHTRIVYTGI